MPEQNYNTAKLVDGYKKAFIDSSIDADPSYSPQFIYNGNGRKVLTAIEEELKNCDDLFFSVAFINQSGIAPLLGYFDELQKKGIKGRILTTDYLMFSEPKALDTLNNLSNLELRMFKTEDSKVGFHTKGYMFHNDGNLRIIIGSSNLTQSAITRNHEWNTKFVSSESGEYAQQIENEFNSIWDSSVCYDNYKSEYEKKYADNAKERKELKKLLTTLDLGYSQVVQPNAMQEEFCVNIESLIESGQKRALLISATGTGKTYASAFAVRNVLTKALITKKKVLFLSHREQINIQARKSYQRIFGSLPKMALLSGNHNDIEEAKSADFLFSTMQMMSKDDIRENNFSPNEFAFIILDECHRSGAESYQRIINYFKPEFLLGMSASPERTDGFDIYQLFDHNIASEIRLQQALENDMLCPFHYYGIQDLTVDGEDVDFRVFSNLVSDKRVQHIIDRIEYYGYCGERVKGLIFCSRQAEARELSNKFNATGKYKTTFLGGGDSQEAREQAINKLTNDNLPEDQRLDYIFTVDIFNEGVDIPEINQVVMLRPTESAIIFVQQLGRGLRKADGKEFVIVLDFIGNYDNNYLIPIALSGDRTGNKDNIRRHLMGGDNVIQGASTIYFDEVSRKRIYASIDAAKMNTGKLLKEEYLNVKNKLGRRPSLIDFDKIGELDPVRIISYCSSYYNFLCKYDDYDVQFSELQIRMLDFLSTKLATGKRPHELELLKILISDNNENVIERWTNILKDNHNITVDSITLTNVINVLNTKFFGVGSAKKAVDNCIFIEPSGDGEYSISKIFKNEIHGHPEFVSFIEDLICFGLSRYKRDYSHTDKCTSFNLYKKYTYEDVCRLLNWKQNQVALNIGGYKYDDYTKTYPVFINYDKDEAISDTIKYADRFVNPSNLIAISKSNRTIDSDDVQTALNSEFLGVKMLLFVRKNKDDKESKEFYYLGTMKAQKELTEQFTMPNTQSDAVEIHYKLDTPVETNLYEYITEQTI